MQIDNSNVYAEPRIQPASQTVKWTKSENGFGFIISCGPHTKGPASKTKKHIDLVDPTC